MTLMGFNFKPSYNYKRGKCHCNINHYIKYSNHRQQLLIIYNQFPNWIYILYLIIYWKSDKN